jgi:molybdopterin converting factor small subunit
MKVRVQFFAQLRDIAGVQTLNLDVPDSVTVSELLEKLYSQFPALRERDKGILVGAGVEFVDRNYKLRPDEEISIMPPVQGG